MIAAVRRTIMSQQPRSRLPLILAVAFGVLLIVIVRLATGGGGKGGASGTPTQTARPNPGNCLQLAVTASSEKAALLKQIAAAFEQSGVTVQGRCVQVNVTSKASGGAAEALARGWDESIDGPRPDVWSPASSSWVQILRQRAAERDAPNILPDSISHVAQTPLVIAMPKPMAEALGWPKKAIGWSDILSLAQDPAGWAKFGHPEWGAFRLGKTNPNFSTSGLNATIAAYFAATGLSSDLKPSDVQSAKAQDFAKGVESAVVHYGDTTLTFLSNLQAADDRGQGLSYISAVTVEEKSVWDYNKGNPTGDPTTLGKHAPPHTPLVAIYPKEGTLVSDNPYVVLNSAWVDAAKKAAAADFLKFLQQPAQQQQFQHFAFRDFDGRPGAEISEANGMLPDEPKTIISPPSPPVLDLILRSWTELRKRARVLMVIDVSGSMGDSVPNAGATKLELAKRAAITALSQFGPEDELGLWIFSSDFPPNHRPYLELIPIQPVRDVLGQLKSKISSLTPQQGTALYATIRAANQAMQTGYDPSRINAVVLLTDGRNEYPQDTDLSGLLRQLQGSGEERAVRIFPIAYGDDADLRTLTAIAQASRAAAYNASDPASIDKVFTAVVSNF
jgi:Ca-activated chloride channel homolog